MPAKDLGTKYTCFKCGAKFYDMKKPEPICPKCGADQRESPASKPSPAPRSAAPKRPRPSSPRPRRSRSSADEDAERDEDEDEADEDEP